MRALHRLLPRVLVLSNNNTGCVTKLLGTAPRRRTMEISFGKTRSEVTLQHLDYGQVIGGTCINPYSVMKTMEISFATMAELQRKICVENGDAYNMMFFTKWQQIEYFPEFYNQQIDFKDPFSYVQFVNRRINIPCQVLSIGNTSQKMEAAAFEVKTSKPVLYANITIININPATHTPAHTIPPKCTENYDKPQNALSYTQSSYINAMEVDRNGHTNQAFYTTLCYNCLADAFFKKVFVSSGSIFDYQIRRITLLFVKESRLGDTVDATVWQDSDDSFVYKFHITKKENLLCQAEIELFPSQAILASNQ